MGRNDMLAILAAGLLGLCSWWIVYLVSHASMGPLFFVAPFEVLRALSPLQSVQLITAVLSVPFIVVGLWMMLGSKKRKT
jgi:hypothetical protein